MSYIQNFDFYKPALSTDIVKPPEISSNNDNNNNNSQLNVSNQQFSNEQFTNKKRKNKKRKNKSYQQQQQQQKEILNKINIKIPETQEDIDAWLAERRKKFPTRKRIEAKEQYNQERKERGALDLSEKANKEKRKELKRKNQNFNFDSDKPIEMSVFRPTKLPSILDKITQDEERKKHSIVLQCFLFLKP